MSKLLIIKSNARETKDSYFGFRNQYYIVVIVAFNEKIKDVRLICIDSECTISLINDIFLKTVLPRIKRTIFALIRVRGLGVKLYICTEAVMLPMFFLGFKDGKSVIAQIERLAKVVIDLLVGILCGMDIIRLEGINLHLKTRKMIIGSCKNFTINLKITPSKARINVSIQLKRKIVIPLRITIRILFIYRRKARN